jgi:plasmid stabilization system protein ParE
MRATATLRAEARRELADAFDWYESQKPGLGERFLLEVGTAVAEIEEFPFRYSSVRGEVRRKCLRKFPHCLYYLVRDRRVLITAVFHGRRDPRHLEERR